MSNATTTALAASDRSRTLSARFVSNRLALFSLTVIILLALSAAVGPGLWAVSATTQDYDAINAWPSPVHPLGTDDLGRDTWRDCSAGCGFHCWWPCMWKRSTSCWALPLA